VVMMRPQQEASSRSAPPNYSKMLRSDLWRLFVTLGVLFAVVTSLIAALGSGKDAGATDALRVELSEFNIEPAELNAEADAPVVIDVQNTGAAVHNLSVSGQGATEMLDPGESAKLDLGTLPAGTYELACDVTGHKESGMKGRLVVGDGSQVTAGHMDPADMDASYMRGVKAFPAKTKGLGGQPMTPKLVGGTKVFDLTADETRWEVAPGDVRDAMAYNGVVPGPEIRVREGDRIRVVLHNKLEESTAIHFHGLNVPNSVDGVPGLTQDLVKPGESYSYEFDVPNAGTHMYHSHMNGATQIPMGLLGGLIVEGRDEPEVDVDTSIVLNDGPLGFTINGKGFPATQPIAAKPGQRVRLRYMNEGLQGHPMHLHGMEQLVIAKDGWKLDQPYRADTVWVAPGERYDVIVEAREGLWAFHCHILSHAEGPEGMFGMVTVMAVQ